jgi:hypothetical protein
MSEMSDANIDFKRLDLFGLDEVFRIRHLNYCTDMTTRSRRSFGRGYNVPYKAADPSHQGRELKRSQDRVPRVGPVWDYILSKVWLLKTLVHFDSLKASDGHVVVHCYNHSLGCTRPQIDLRSFETLLISHQGIPETEDLAVRVSNMTTK